jgi:uncharacterized membrane protein
MILMLAGLALFLASHGFPAMRGPRAAVIARVGDVPYKVLYSLVSILAVLMIGYGYAEWRAEGAMNVWDPPNWTRHLAILLMLLASIMLVGAYSNGRIKAVLNLLDLEGVDLLVVEADVATGDWHRLR